MRERKYLISDAAKKVEVESHVLRYWEEELGLEIPRNELGHRYYKEVDISLFLSIKRLKDKGFQLKAIRMLIPDISRISALENDRLLDLRDKLDALLGVNREEDLSDDMFKVLEKEVALTKKLEEPNVKDEKEDSKEQIEYEEKIAKSVTTAEGVTITKSELIEEDFEELDLEIGQNELKDECENINITNLHGKQLNLRMDMEDYEEEDIEFNIGKQQSEFNLEDERPDFYIEEEKDGYEQVREKPKNFDKRSEEGLYMSQSGGKRESTRIDLATYRENNKVIDMTGVISMEQSDIVGKGENGQSEDKLTQFRAIMSSIMADAVKQNNDTLVQEVNMVVSDSVRKEVEYLLHLQEEREEERFKKLDRTIREYQLSRQQSAAAKEVEHKKRKKSKFFKKNKVRI